MTQTPQGPRPIVITQAERNQFGTSAWDKDAAYTDGSGSLITRLGSYLQTGKTQGQLDELLDQAVAAYRDPNKKGEITFDPSTGKYNFGYLSNLNSSAIDLLTGSKGITDSDKFQKAFYKRIQAIQQQEGLDKPIAITSANGEVIGSTTLRDQLESLNQGGLNTARLSGTGFTRDSQGRIINSLGGEAPSVLIGGNAEGEPGRIDPRIAVSKIKQQVTKQAANKQLLQSLEQLRLSGDLTDEQAKKLKAAQLMANPAHNAELKNLKAIGDKAQTRRISAEDIQATDRATYGVVDPATGQRTAPTFAGQQAIQAEQRLQAGEQRANETHRLNKNTTALNNWSTLNTASFNLQKLAEEVKIAKMQNDAERERIKLQNEASMTRWREEMAYKKAEKDEDRRIEMLTRGYGSVADILGSIFAFV